MLHMVLFFSLLAVGFSFLVLVLLMVLVILMVLVYDSRGLVFTVGYLFSN